MKEFTKLHSADAEKKAGIYLRTDEENSSFANQIEDLERFIAQNGWTSNKYIDNGYNGDTIARPALYNMLVDVNNGKISCIVTPNAGHLFSDAGTLRGFLLALKNKNVCLLTKSNHIDTTDINAGVHCTVLTGKPMHCEDLWFDSLIDAISEALTQHL